MLRSRGVYFTTGGRPVFAVQPSVAKADTYKKHNYDLICFFDCLHDMGRPFRRYAVLRSSGGY